MFSAFFGELWNILLALSPWLFTGAAIAGLFKIILPPGFINRQIGKKSFGSVLKAVLVGVPMPLCSCGVIPAAIGLKKEGASNGSTVGFLISTPQTGMDSILVTASFLGWPLALFKVLAALVTGLVGGQVVDLLAPVSTPKAAETGGQTTAPCELTPARPRWLIFFTYTIEDLIGGIYKYLILGIFIAALISWLLPPNYLAQFPALRGVWGMFAMIAIGIPLYVCSTGSVPIAASLIHAGLPLGSAMVFLISGPATNAATISAVYRVFGRKITFLYLGIIILGSLFFGFLFQSLFTSAGIAALPMHHHGSQFFLQKYIAIASASALVFLLARWSFLDLQRWLKAVLAQGSISPTTARPLELQVEGMTCMNCATQVEQALEKVPGVKHVTIRLDNGQVKVFGQKLNNQQLIAAIQKAGYQVRGCA